MTPIQKRLFQAMQENRGNYIIDKNGFVHITDKAMKEAIEKFHFPPQKTINKNR